ncbi:TPA: BspA family leucine-rich repeat surface protein, partial [Vibrio parahaemolyticus]|nr:BspA family leucine-rich repeat surface protein [Vibrio parahaemolyticus]
NQDISGWNVSNGTYFSGMFAETSTFNQDISGWNVTAATNWYNFNLSSSLASENIPAKFR